MFKNCQIYYIESAEWLKNVTSGDYQAYYKKQYETLKR